VAYNAGTKLVAPMFEKLPTVDLDQVVRLPPGQSWDKLGAVSVFCYTALVVLMEANLENPLPPPSLPPAATPAAAEHVMPLPSGFAGTAVAAVLAFTLYMLMMRV
jgi:hypothetical protein